MVDCWNSQLASNGFAALALAYFLHDDLPKELHNVELEYFIEAVDWLKNHPSIIPGGVGVMGISKGAQIAILLASNCADVKAVVSICGFYGLSKDSISFRQCEIPSIKFEFSNIILLKNFVLNFRHCYVDDWAEKVEENPKAIPVEKACASFLIIYGSDDHAFNSELGALNIYNRLKVFGKESQCTILGYHGAGHLIEPPYSPLSSMSYQKSVNQYMSWGGESKAHACAQEHSWRRILSFFRENLPQRTTSKL